MIESVKADIRVLHLRSSGGLLGAENVVLELAKESQSLGYEAIVGALKNIDDPMPEFIYVANARGLRTVIFECDGSFDLRVALKIKKFIHRNHVNILHCHGYKEDFYGFIALSGIPKMATNHLWKISTLKAKCYCLIDSLVIRYYDKIIGVSDEIVQGMKKMGVRNALKIANGVDCLRFNVKPLDTDFAITYKLHPTDFVIGMVSSLSHEKNHQAALNAMAFIDNPNLKLLIVGSGKLEVDLRKQVKEKGLAKRVVFTGSLSDITPVLSVINLFLLPSLNEGLPMALLEAMASGKPVVASNVGAVENVVEHGVSGLLIEKNNLHELISAIEFFIQNEDKLHEYGRAGRQAVESKFSSKIMTLNYAKVYNGMIS